MEDKNYNHRGKSSEEHIHRIISERYSKNINERHDSRLSLGDKIADKVAEVAGSWTFITGFIVCLAAWICLNTVWIISRPFDPYPFILLNLVLSCIAAIQAPVIMMSQNRQEEKDRLRAQNDYEINLKSEYILEDLHLKIDKLLENQETLLKNYTKISGEMEDIKKELRNA